MRQAGRTTSPGLHFKLPLIQQVVRYDRRILNLDAQPERYFTSEKKAVNVDFYVKWKIENAATYYRSFGADEFQTLASQRLALDHQGSAAFRVQLASAQRSDRQRALRHHRARASSRPTRRRWTRSASASSMCASSASNSRTKSSDSVYNRMRAERTRLANEQRSNGKEAAAKIKADADRQVQVIKAEAERDAQQTRGEGDAKGAEIYAAAYTKDPEFYAFYRSLGAYREAFKSGDVMVLDPKSEFLRYFGESKIEGK